MLIYMSTTKSLNDIVSPGPETLDAAEIAKHLAKEVGITERKAKKIVDKMAPAELTAIAKRAGVSVELN